MGGTFGSDVARLPALDDTKTADLLVGVGWLASKGHGMKRSRLER